MINVHNIMEELVIDHVNTLYDQVKERNSPWLTCDCQSCRLDTVSYVLNRIPPRYVVGGRGMTHNTNYLKENNQISVDLDKLCIEGMRIVSTAKRPYHKDNRKNPLIGADSQQAEFNFPTFIGNIYDGQTFEPLAGASLHLLQDGHHVDTVDITWPNPCMTYEATNGNYAFWIASIPAVSDGMNKKFSFSIEASCPGYEDVTYSFVVPLTSEKIDRRELNTKYSLKIQDIFMFRADEEK